MLRVDAAPGNPEPVDSTLGLRFLLGGRVFGGFQLDELLQIAERAQGGLAGFHFVRQRHKRLGFVLSVGMRLELWLRRSTLLLFAA